MTCVHSLFVCRVSPCSWLRPCQVRSTGRACQLILRHGWVLSTRDAYWKRSRFHCWLVGSRHPYLWNDRWYSTLLPQEQTPNVLPDSGEPCELPRPNSSPHHGFTTCARPYRQTTGQKSSNTPWRKRHRWNTSAPLVRRPQHSATCSKAADATVRAPRTGWACLLRQESNLAERSRRHHLERRSTSHY